MTTARKIAVMVLRRVKTGSRQEQSTLRRMLVRNGATVDDVATELARRWQFRPRAAYRHAYGWSQVEAAVRFREVGSRLIGEPASTSAPAVAGNRIGEYERWPQGGRRPSPYVLAVLSEVYGTTVGQLLDTADLEAMPPPARAVVVALAHRQDGTPVRH